MSRKAHEFKPGEEATLRAVCPDADFVAGCWKIRRRYIRNLSDLPSRRPSAETRHYRDLRRAYQPKPNIKAEPPKLRPIDVVNLALIDPELRVWDEPEKSQRAADAFKQLEQRPRSPTSSPQWPEIMAAKALKWLFEAHGLPFTDYLSRDHDNSRGKAAMALAVIVGDKCDLRHLIRLARGKRSS